MHCFNASNTRNADLVTGIVARTATASALVLLPVTALGAEAGAVGDNWLWSLLIAAVVLIFTFASAMLPLAALRQWSGPWRYIAAAPLILLILWAGLIVSRKAINPTLHPLWPLEIFAWAMLNMIYMVAAMTAKRLFLKADEEQRAKH